MDGPTHSYNAKSGVGIIIGQATGKLLFIGVRNKYCSACTQGISPDEHKCYKNWDDSSSEMESDIILEGFKKAEATHEVRYLRFIGDGDICSSLGAFYYRNGVHQSCM